MVETNPLNSNFESLQFLTKSEHPFPFLKQDLQVLFLVPKILERRRSNGENNLHSNIRMVMPNMWNIGRNAHTVTYLES